MVFLDLLYRFTDADTRMVSGIELGDGSQDY